MCRMYTTVRLLESSFYAVRGNYFLGEQIDDATQASTVEECWRRARAYDAYMTNNGELANEHPVTRIVKISVTTHNAQSNLQGGKMDIENVTIGELKSLLMFARNLHLAADEATGKDTAHPFIGQYVLCRCYAAGVHVGKLAAIKDDHVILHDSRRLWSWEAKSGIALSGVAQYGATGKFDTVNPQIAIMGVIEIIPMTRAAKECIYAVQ